MNKHNNKTNLQKMLRDFLIATIFLNFLSAILCNYILWWILIEVLFSIVLIGFYFFKVYKKVLLTKDYFCFSGFLGMACAVNFALLSSVISQKIIFGLIILGIIILLVLIMEFVMYLIHEKEVKIRESTAGMIIGAPAGVFGIMLSRYFRKNGLEINYEYIIGCLAVVYSFSYFAIIKYRQLKKTTKTKW